MDRPEAPRRKSSASENDDLATKVKDARPHRKSFVVGGKNHHNRVPSYGKKLNQLGKLTALTTSESKHSQECLATEPQRRASIHRSQSQKSLIDARSSRRNGSAHDVRKMQRSISHHGSSTRLTGLTGLKAMTKVEVHIEDDPVESANAKPEEVDCTPKSVVKRPTFVIDDEEETFDDELQASSPPMCRLPPEETGRTNDHSGDIIFGTDQHKELRLRRELTQSSLHKPSPKTTSVPQRAHDAVPLHSISRHPDLSKTQAALLGRRPSGSGLLYHPHSTPAGPQLSTEAVVSRDIQGKERPLNCRSSTMHDLTITPVNSQPLTSRFLESPRRIGTSTQNTTHSATNIANATKETESTLPYKRSFYHQSPHGSTTSLGGGVSRTQQKLLLQRASSIHLDTTTDVKDDSKQSGTRIKVNKEIDRIAREYKNVQRFRNPLRELTFRLYAKGLTAPQTQQPLRRTMTQLSLVSETDDTKAPKVSRSSSNLGQQQQQQGTHADLSARSHSRIYSLLTELWAKDDYESAEE